MGLQVIHDGNGKNTGVFIPYKEWSKLKKMHKDLAALEHEDEDTKEDILANINEGLEEVQLFKKGRLKTIPAKDFLNGL